MGHSFIRSIVIGYFYWFCLGWEKLGAIGLGLLASFGGSGMRNPKLLINDLIYYEEEWTEDLIREYSGPFTNDDLFFGEFIDDYYQEDSWS